MTAAVVEPDLEQLVDPRCGIVRAVEPVALHAHLPRALRVVAAPLSRLDAAGRAAGAATPGGAAWWDGARARAAAIGEAAERYCATAPRLGLRRASAAGLRASSRAAVDPAALALYSAEQYATPGFPFARFTADLPVLWVQGADTATGEPVNVPACLVHLNHLSGPTSDEPRTNLPINAGLAAAPALPEAVAAALEELIERHAVATAWLRGDRLPALDPGDWLRALLGAETGALEVRVHLVPNAFSLPVAAVLVTDRETGVLGMGTALRPNLRSAVLKAAAEAVTSCQAAHQLQDDGGVLTSALAAAPGAPVKPWRADRGYLRDYRPDWRDVTDVFCHVQLYLDPAMWPPLAQRLDGPEAVPLAAAPCREVNGRGAYAQRVRTTGRRVLAVDLTTPDVAACGLAVARVVVPGLRATAPAAFPFLGGGRDPAATISDPCDLPLPHA